jgi:hypothetical protein
MFTDDDREFLDRLGVRAQASLSASDTTIEQLRAAIRALRSAVAPSPVADEGADEGAEGAARLDQVHTLLDVIEWSTSSGERERARTHAAALARAVRELNLSGMRAMRAVDAAQQIRCLVVLAA